MDAGWVAPKSTAGCLIKPGARVPSTGAAPDGCLRCTVWSLESPGETRVRPEFLCSKSFPSPPILWFLPHGVSLTLGSEDGGPKGAGRWLDWASCHILANAGSKPLLTPHLFILEIFNARLLFARHNLYPQEFVSREAARKEAQIAINCNECPKVGPVRAGE